MRHVSEAVRFRFTEAELLKLEKRVFKSLFPGTSLSELQGERLWVWSRVSEMIHAIDEAHPAYSLTSESIRKIIESMQAAYYNAFLCGTSEVLMRAQVCTVAQTCLERHLGVFNRMYADDPSIASIASI